MNNEETDENSSSTSKDELISDLTEKCKRGLATVDYWEIEPFVESVSLHCNSE